MRDCPYSGRKLPEALGCAPAYIPSPCTAQARSQYQDQAPGRYSQRDNREQRPDGRPKGINQLGPRPHEIHQEGDSGNETDAAGDETGGTGDEVADPGKQAHPPS